MTAITLTFDNLGEATALERGTWSTRPGSLPLGADPSVTVALPRLLDELDHHGLAATFCVEAINCGLYPGAVREIAARGHELAMHGWRHERWSELEPDRERELLRRSREAFAELGLAPVRFRPPGGAPAAADPELLAEHGITWWSPAADAQLPAGPIDTVPFDWDLVDAYLLMESFAELRAQRGEQAARLSPATAGARLRERISSGADPLVVVLHPFLMLDEAWWAEVRGLLRMVAAVT
jgi:peptidoglycan/xylan/chitin deacetylase (PgdA/CDA1 family)